MLETNDLIIFWVVVVARFAIPLLIPRYPLPAILAALIIDAVDQTIFQQFTNLPLAGYQGYDKALDVYYLVIAYISTLRNWENQVAFKVSRFLIYWRLVGVTAFELVHWRPLLLIFPNTFEYFFIFYEGFRLRWDPRKMSKGFVLGAAALIWIVIKLPQEWWIHIAQLDTTDFIKETLLGMSKDASLKEILTQHWWLIPATFIALLLLVLLLRLVIKRLPPAERTFSFDANTYQPEFPQQQIEQAHALQNRSLLDWSLFEKIALVSLVSIIFAQVLPDIQASNTELVLGIALIIVLNTAISHWLSRRGREWRSAIREFAAMFLLNVGLVFLFHTLLARSGGALNLTNTLFFILLLTMLVTLFDRYRTVYLMRFTTNKAS